MALGEGGAALFRQVVPKEGATGLVPGIGIPMVLDGSDPDDVVLSGLIPGSGEVRTGGVGFSGVCLPEQQGECKKGEMKVFLHGRSAGLSVFWMLVGESLCFG